MSLLVRRLVRMRLRQSLLKDWTRSAMRVAFHLLLRLAIVVLVTASRLKNQMDQDNTQEALLLILLFIVLLSVSLSLIMLFNSDSLASAWQRDLSM